MTRTRALVVLTSFGAALARPGRDAAAAHARTGRISGAIVAQSSATYPADIDGILRHVRVVARIADGSSVGTFHYGVVPAAVDGVVRVPYTVVGLPFGVDLRVRAERVTVEEPSPEPTGLFLTFVVRKMAGDLATDFYAPLLDGAHAEATGCDFAYATIEVPPMPGPRPTPTPTPTPTSLP